MITTIDEIPALTERWIAPLRHADRALYDELAASLVIERATPRPADWSPPDPSLAIVASGALKDADVALIFARQLKA